MLKKLFGKSNANKYENLTQATENLIETISEESLNKNVNKSLEDCMKFLPDSSKEEVDNFMFSIFELIISPNLRLAQASLAMTVCGHLIEKGCPSDAILEPLIETYKRLLEQSKPFFDILDKEVKKGESGDADEHIDEDSLYKELIDDRERVSIEEGKAAVSIDEFYTGAVSIFSVNAANCSLAKAALQDKLTPIIDYSQGAYWLDRLFSTLFNEPLLVLDLDSGIGFEGKISGVSDNYQLQHLLMGLPQLNDTFAISEEGLSVANGSGMQTSNIVQENKWDMWNCDVCKQANWEEEIENAEKAIEWREYWIWGEGTPADITLCDGYRLILLSPATVKRTTRIQRTFRNLKANIEIEKSLSDQEFDTWIDKLTNSK